MRIAVDQNITAARDTFTRHGDVIRVDGRHLSNEHMQGVDALIIRSVTKVDAGLLQHTPVGFVGTTTIGTDHLDIPWLEQQGITWANAPGCNADSAAQYTLAMIWLACERLGRSLADQRVGIIGRGNVGSRVQTLLQAIGADTVANDPPLADSGVSGLVSLEEALAQDIICLHVPLTRNGPYPTFQFIAQQQLAQMPDGALLVNSARGDVIDGQSLKRHLAGQRLHAAFDCWPGEPDIDTELLKATTVATPHIAGYSDDGKRNGTMMVYDAFCDWAGETSVTSGHDADGKTELTIEAESNVISAALDAACFVRKHDQAMKDLSRLPPEQRPLEFDRLRREYPRRRDFHAWKICCEQTGPLEMLSRLGFSLL